MQLYTQQIRSKKIAAVFLTVLIVLPMYSCWMTPEFATGPTGVTDDFSAHPMNAGRETQNFSDFITSVYQAPADQQQNLVDSFMLWADSATGIPYIEDTSAIFLYQTNSNIEVAIAGDFTGWDPSDQNMSRLSATNLYYKEYEFEVDARLDYKIVANGNWILDPLNPNTCSGGYGPNSELSMASYIQPLEIQEYDFSHGHVSITSFSDTTQGRTRPVKIYTPPGYAEGNQNYRTIYFHDGSEYLTLGSADNVLDYLIVTHAIPPVIAIFVDPTNRNDEYSYDYEFMEMFVNELVPWVDSAYRTMEGAENRGVAGVSLGGLTSLLFTIQYPEVFGNCGAYSPAIWIGDIRTQYAEHSVLPVKIYMDAGTYEPSIFNSSLELLETLEVNAWEHKWESWHEGHSWGAWRAHLDESLTYFWPLHTSGIDESY